MRDINEIKKRAEIYSKSQTLSFISETMPSGRKNFYNGFIIKIHTDMLIFFDIVIKKEFPILLENIEIIEPSKKEINIQTAWEIYKKSIEKV